MSPITHLSHTFNMQNNRYSANKIDHNGLHIDILNVPQYSVLCDQCGQRQRYTVSQRNVSIDVQSLTHSNIRKHTTYRKSHFQCQRTAVQLQQRNMTRVQEINYSSICRLLLSFLFFKTEILLIFCNSDESLLNLSRTVARINRLSLLNGCSSVLYWILLKPYI